ncbi:MAG: WG repeat-containing protein [Sphingobacteriaceae bacterium]|nr:WG repeat-containing protein [Sphingobacteriaceae bacterium]
MKADIRQEYYVHRFDENGNAQISKDGLFGVIDKDGKIIIPCIYEAIVPIGQIPRPYDPGVLCFGDEGFTSVKLKGNWGVVDRSNRMILYCSYDKIFGYSEGIFNVIKGDSCGSIDLQGKTIINFSFTRILPFESGYAIYYNATRSYNFYHSERFGIVNKNGKIIFDAEFTSMLRLPACFLAGTEKSAYSFRLDKDGHSTPIEEIKYVEGFRDKLAIFYTPKDKSGVISHKGHIVVPGTYDGILRGRKYFYAYNTLSDGNRTYFVMDMDGAVVKQVDGLDSLYFRHDIVFFQIKTGRYTSTHGTMDEDLNVILPALYKQLWEVTFGLICAEVENGKAVLIDYIGNCLMTIDKPIYNLGMSFGIISLPLLVSVDGIHLEIDSKARILRELPYSFIYQQIEYFGSTPYCFHYAYMGTKLDKRSASILEKKVGATVGILDHKLNVIVRPKYTTINNLKKHKDLFVVSLGEEKVTRDEDGYPVTASGLKFGVINSEEEFIVPLIYESVNETSYNLFLVTKGGESVFERDEYEWYCSGDKKGLVNLEGVEIVPPIYESIVIYDYIFAYYKRPTPIDIPQYDVYDLFGNIADNNAVFVYDENKPCIDYFY